jgi:hypothetical protein
MPKKINLLDSFVPSSRVERYSFAISGNATEDKKFVISGNPKVTIRPYRAMTSLTEPNQVIIESIKIGNVECLACTMMDAFTWSVKYVEQIECEFMKEIEVNTKQQLYQYCDDNDLEIPNPTLVDFPTIRQGELVEVKGFYGTLPVSELFILSIIGAGFSPAQP